MSQQQKSPHEEFIMTTIVAGLIFGISFVIWKFFHVQLTEMLRWIRVGEMWIASLYMDPNYQIVYPGIPEPQKLKVWLDWLSSERVDVASGDITPFHLKVITNVALPPLRWPIIGILALLALIVMFKGPGTHYHRRMGLEGLMREQAKSFPVIAPFLKFNPLKLKFRVLGQAVPSKLPIFSEALSPEEWVAHNRISFEGRKLDVAQAYQAFAKQLGPRWRGPKHLPLHLQGLYAAFALKHVRKRGECEKLLNELALSWTPDHGFKPPAKVRRKIKKIINDPKIGGALEPFTKQHAFQTTAMLKALQRARQEGGVLAPAEFLWLRGHDRMSWYPLNNLGRKSYHAEASGAMVHFTNELIAGQKIPTPRFEDVIQVLEDNLKIFGARPIPPLEETKERFKFW